MKNSSLVVIPVGATQKNLKYPVFIEYTNDYKRENGLSNEVDCFSPRKYERTPQTDCYEGVKQCIGANCMAMKAPNPSEIVKGMAVIPIILETGKQILVGIFDIRDVWNDRTGSKGHNLQAVVFPDEVTEKIMHLNTEA